MINLLQRVKLYKIKSFLIGCFIISLLMTELSTSAGTQGITENSKVKATPPISYLSVN